MVDPKMKNELRLLVNLSLEGQATEQQYHRLNELLRSNRDVFDYYLELIELHHILQICDWRIEHESVYSLQNILKELSVYEQTAPKIEIARDNTSELIQEVIYPHTKKRQLSKFNIFVLVTSAAMLFLAIIFTKFAPPAGGVLVGTLSRTVDAQWESAAEEIVVGCELRSGTLTLTKGLAEILFEDGATVILEAPIEFTLESSRQMYIAAGKAVAKIQGEDKKAFVIRSPYGTVVDYGTEFGVQVGSDEIETHVFQGIVALRDGDDPVKFSDTLILNAGEGGCVKPDGKLEKKWIDLSEFVRDDEFNIRYKASNGSPYDRWIAYSYQLRQDPDLIAYYTFEKDPNSSARIANKANITKGLFDVDMNDIPDQQRPTWTSGRWEQKEALAFDRQRRQYLKTDGASPLYQNGPITLAAWIKCPGQEDGGHILSNRKENLGACNYQFGYKVRKLDGYSTDRPNLIQLARKMSNNDDRQIYSPILTADPDWMFIAVTHDNHMVTFYQNGRMVQSSSWEIQQEPIETDLWIGSDGEASYLDRYFSGMMDELIILKRALGANDIREMYESGKP